MDFEDDNAGQMDATPVDVTDDVTDDGKNPPIPERDKKLVEQIIRTIKEDKRHHDKAFGRMRRDMQVAMWGAEENWGENNYRANVTGRHVKMKTAALYAKNPRATAKRRETLDFAIWDENPQTLQLAFQTAMAVQQAVAVAQQAQAAAPIDQATGMPAVVEPQLPPGAQEAQALIADFQQGMQRRQFLTRYGKTLEILFAQALREQKPVDFKRGMKQLVRRTSTTGVGYIELGFQREFGPRPGMTEKLADARARLDHLRNLTEELGDGEFSQDDGEMAELEHAVAQLQQEPEIILREGLIVDFPQSTKVIPDRLCKQLDGFIGARHLTLEYSYTVDEVKELFKVDLGDSYTGYSAGAGSTREISSNDVMDDDYEWSPPSKKKNGLVCVWKHYDKPSGLVYYVADGYHGFLRPPAAPDVFVEDFWPVYALTFNAVESEKELFPPSDVTLLLDMQREYNRSRQGLREHRYAARPRYVFANGIFDEENPLALKNLKPFEALGLNMDPTAKIGDILQVVPVPGVDPNLYETGQLFSDMQLVGGAQEAQYGGVSKSTATESAIAANSTNASDGSSIDDLDAFLTVIARASGQVLQREMSEEKVMEVVGPGAVWPDVTLADIAGEVFLEVEAGSTGKPNQAVEINNWKQIVPLLLQIPNINPEWLARETLRRLDDRMDLTEAIVSGIPAIVAQNTNAQPNMADAASDPNAQGGKGANNAPQAPAQPGTDAAFGSNQV
ncbi:hypothetical protein [Aminobacter sp. BE322]|uniref:hypothetical protein n=1 Tax=unclassified Aminobacter TaxID=2644704 RepID=UPI003D23DA39